MPTGDSLSILLFLVGSSFAAMMGALTAQPGWRCKTLWGIAVAFGVASGLWMVAPTASPIIQALKPIAAAVVQSGALVMVGTVGIVSLMLGGRKPKAPGFDLATLKTPAAPRPNFAVLNPETTKWKPDTSFLQAMLYLHGDTRWGSGNKRDPEEIKNKLDIALHGKRILSWGKTHPDDDVEFQIRSEFWTEVELTLESNTVFSKYLNATAYEVRLSRGQLEASWPPKPQPKEPKPTSPPA